MLIGLYLMCPLAGQIEIQIISTFPFFCCKKTRNFSLDKLIIVEMLYYYVTFPSEKSHIHQEL